MTLPWRLASELSMPIGFKSSTDGDVQGAVDAVAAASPQVFPGITDDGRAAILATSGNPDCHVVLRGGTSRPNYDERGIADAVDRLTVLGRAGDLLRGQSITDACMGCQETVRVLEGLARAVTFRRGLVHTGMAPPVT